MKIFLNEKFIGLLIAINALLTVYLFFDNAPFADVIQYLDSLIILLFVCEATYKICFYKKRYFKSNWNRFDFIVTSVSFLFLILDIVGLNLEILENIVILRTLRLFRFFRVLKVVPDIDKIFNDLKAAIKVTSGILVFGLIVLLVIGVILCSVYKDINPVNFGDPLVAIYTVFRIFSVEGWYEIPDAMCEKTSYLNATFIRILFSILVLFGTFILGFIISSITDKLAKDNNENLEKQTKELENKIDKLTETVNILAQKNNQLKG